MLAQRYATTGIQCFLPR